MGGEIIDQRKFYSSIGRQASSLKKSMPSVGFPQGPARENDSIKPGRVGPGSYAMRSSMGRQVLSTNKQVIAAKFMKGKRPEPKATNNDVGPSQYDQEKMDTAMKLRISTVRRAPTIKFGTEKARPDYGFASVTKNVGKLKLVPSIGTQVLSHSRSAPRVLMASRVKLVGDRAEPGRIGPGPCYKLPGSTGPQVESMRASQSGIAFGSAPRGELSKDAKDAPGPGAYTNPTSIGTQVSSTRRTQPAPTIAGRELFGSMIQNPYAAKYEPGPGHYAVHNAQYRINGHKNAPNITMGTRWWQSKAPNRSGPGPGSYKLPQAAGKQIESKKRSSTGVAFGKASQRPNVQENTDGIGPGEYVLPSTIGRQKLSTVRSEPAIGFCKDKQRPDYSKDGNAYVPGPGQYKYSVQKCPVYKRAPIVSLSSRTKFGSVYG